MASGLQHFARGTRVKFSCSKKSARVVYVSEFIQTVNGAVLPVYVADQAPLFYRDIATITASLQGYGGFLTAIKETLARIPSSESFRESHFGEIAACLFAEDVLGLRRLYSKLSLLTAENANAFKMDLVLYDPTRDPVEFVFGEVKSSCKNATDGYPCGHDRSCFASAFKSLNAYSQSDLEFDLGAAKVRLEGLPPEERARVKEALRSYGGPRVAYGVFIVIDTSSKHDGEITTLATRKNAKTFDVDIICVEELGTVAERTYELLERYHQQHTALLEEYQPCSS
jgi:hypothetical protein